MTTTPAPHDIGDALMADMEAHFKAHPDAEYAALLEAVKIGRKLGFSDAELEVTIGIRLKPEDRQAI
ncbi:MAG TPA: hypothetical protein DCW68_02920 [Rhodospirillaceae bacterium]|nr:MAG: hypothetical protein A2018_05895 [Alphaproteobacteria bacterium GWF2_58_20]HAU29044.1 hypothetical protein [Rhodospirillaceae bacterium]